MFHLPKNRWQAFAIHLGISSLIFIVLLSAIMFVWFPGVFMQMGGWQGVKIVAGVDLVLGPLLTLIVFNPAKKELKFDLAAIALLQLACLSAGVWFLYQERPLAEIVLLDNVYVLTHADFKLYSLPLPDDARRSFLNVGPARITLDIDGTDEEIVTKIIMSEFGGEPIWANSEDYRSTVPSIEKEERCITVDIVSAHYSGKGCFSYAEGLLKLE